MISLDVSQYKEINTLFCNICLEICRFPWFNFSKVYIDTSRGLRQQIYLQYILPYFDMNRWQFCTKKSLNYKQNPEFIELCSLHWTDYLAFNFRYLSYLQLHSNITSETLMSNSIEFTPEKRKKLSRFLKAESNEMVESLFMEMRIFPLNWMF